VSRPSGAGVVFLSRFESFVKRRLSDSQEIFTHFSAQWCYEDIPTPRDFAPSAGRLNDALPTPRIRLDAMALASPLAEAIHDRFLLERELGRGGVATVYLTRDLKLARIYPLVGEPERALDRLEPLLKIPYYLSPGWLRIDPTFAPLQGNPRFERLVRGS